MLDLAGMSSSESSGISDNLLDVSILSVGKKLFVRETSVDITRSEINTVSSSLLSQGIRGRECVEKCKSIESVLLEASDVGDALVGPTIFSLKMTSRRT